MRARIVGTTASSDEETWGTVRPPRSRMTTTTRRLPDWFSASLRSIRSAQVFRPDMAAEPGAVDLGDASLAAVAQRFHAGCDCLTQLVRQHERGLILDIQITGEGEHALALHLVAESGDREQIRPERQLVPGEQRAGGDREVTATRLTAPARLARRTAAGVADRTTTARADRLAVG